MGGLLRARHQPFPPYLAIRPALEFVGLDHIGECRQLGLFRAALGAAHERVGAIRVHSIGHVGKMRYRVGEVNADRSVFFAIVGIARASRIGRVPWPGG